MDYFSDFDQTKKDLVLHCSGHLGLDPGTQKIILAYQRGISCSFSDFAFIPLSNTDSLYSGTDSIWQRTHENIATFKHKDLVKIQSSIYIPRQTKSLDHVQSLYLMSASIKKENAKGYNNPTLAKILDYTAGIIIESGIDMGNKPIVGISNYDFRGKPRKGLYIDEEWLCEHVDAIKESMQNRLRFKSA